MEDLASVETLDMLRLRVQALEAENAAMRPIVRRMAEARMCRDSVTMIESCRTAPSSAAGSTDTSGSTTTPAW